MGEHRKGTPWSEMVRAHVHELHWYGYSISEIAKLTGVPRATVGLWVKPS